MRLFFYSRTNEECVRVRRHVRSVIQIKQASLFVSYFAVGEIGLLVGGERVPIAVRKRMLISLSVYRVANIVDCIILQNGVDIFLRIVYPINRKPFVNSGHPFGRCSINLREVFIYIFYCSCLFNKVLNIIIIARVKRDNEVVLIILQSERKRARRKRTACASFFTVAPTRNASGCAAPYRRLRRCRSASRPRPPVGSPASAF